MFSVVIPSRNGVNILACVYSILECEPDLDPGRIIVVDDSSGSAAVELACVSFGATCIKGEKPFIYSRNSNIGLRHAFESGADSAILMNDDTRLLTDGGFSGLAGLVDGSVESGAKAVVAPSLTGAVGNRNQIHQDGGNLRPEPRMLCFVAVCISAKAYAEVGPLDERYTSYGADDDDWSWTARSKGYSLHVWDGCLVEHGVLASTFRPGNTGGDYRPNLELFKQKWGHDNFGVPAGHSR